MYLELCTQSQLEDFYAEFEATEETVRRDVQYLKEWMKKQPHLPNIDDDEWLSNFLLRCKNSIERTKNRLDFYFCRKAMIPEFFICDDLSKLVNDLKVFSMVPLPKLTPDGHRIIICHIAKHKSHELPSGDDILSGMQFLLEYLLKRDKVRGVTFVYDAQHMSMSLVATLLQSASKQVLVQNKINPIRYNKIYFMNSPTVARPIINFVLPFIKKEADKLVIWEKDASKLSEDLPRSCLPEEYGGTLPSLQKLKCLFLEEVQKSYPWLQEHVRIVADLNKKEGHIIKKTESAYGMEGSFRKLCVD